MQLQDIMIYVINVISLVVTLIALHFNIKRYGNISELPTTIISKNVKENNLKKLTQNKYVLYVLGALNFLNLFLPNGLTKFIIPAISLVVVTNILIQLFEEIDTFNVSKGEIDLISDFKQKQRQQTLEKAKKRESQLKEKNDK